MSTLWTVQLHVSQWDAAFVHAGKRWTFKLDSTKTPSPRTHVRAGARSVRPRHRSHPFLHAVIWFRIGPVERERARGEIWGFGVPLTVESRALLPADPTERPGWGISSCRKDKEGTKLCRIHPLEGRERANLNIYTCLYTLKYASCWGGDAGFKISQLTAFKAIETTFPYFYFCSG